MLFVLFFALFVYAYVYLSAGAQGGQRRPILLKMEWWVFVSHLMWVLETEFRFSARADARLMAEPPLQSYLRFSYINKTKAAPPLKVLGVYYLVLLPKRACTPNILPLPCCLRTRLKLSCAERDLGQDARQLKSTSLSHWESKPALRLALCSEWLHLAVEVRQFPAASGVLLLCSWADGQVLPAVFRESANSTQLPTTVCFVFVCLFLRNSLNDLSSEACHRSEHLEHSTFPLSQESSIWRWMTEFGQCLLLDPAVFLFLTVIKHRYSYHWVTWDTDWKSKETCSYR